MLSDPYRSPWFGCIFGWNQGERSYLIDIIGRMLRLRPLRVGRHHMADRKQRDPRNKASVNPAVEETYHHREPVAGNGDPRKADGVVKEGVGKHIVEFVDHDDGFLKIRRGLDSSDLHLTWTWSVGTNAGRYVYVRVFSWQVGYGLALLAEKMAECNSGARRATPDKLGHGSR